jgi:hypothetical protein
VTISGYSDSQNNGTWPIKNVRLEGGDTESFTLGNRGSLGTDLTESVTVTQTINRFPPDVDRLTFYPGAADDAIDPLVEADLGIGNTPRFKGVAKMVIERLKLTDYANRLPQFNFVVNRQNPTTVRDAITDIMVRGGFSGSDFDVSGISSGYEIGGYAISGSKSIAAVLEPIMLVWDLGVYEDNGVLKFYDRGDETKITNVRDSDWTAHEHGESARDILTIEEVPSFDLPSEVSISYPDSDGRDEIGEARARRIDYVSDISTSIQVPITMSSGEARALAEKRLWRAWDDRRRATFNLPPRYLQITEGDIVPVVIAGETFDVRLTRVSRGANYLITCEGTIRENEDFDFSADGYVVDDGAGGVVTQPSNLFLFIWNSAALTDEHVSTPGYYWAFALQNYNETFSGGALYRATSEAGTYSLLSTGNEATIVSTEDQLPGVTNPYIFDEANTLEVEVIHGTLSSVNEIDLLNGANRLVMESGEIIAFQTATSIGTNRYRLSKLLRGLRGSERFIDSHPTDGESGVLLDSASINFETHNLSETDSTRYFKAVSNGQQVDDIDEVEFTYASCTVKPFSVVNIEAERDGSNNVTLTWDRRTRSVYPILTATIPVPLVDGVEQYSVDLYDPTGVFIEATFETSSPSVTISDAAIVLAGYSSGDPIRVDVYQVSPSIGRGIVKEATI